MYDIGRLPPEDALLVFSILHEGYLSNVYLEDAMKAHHFYFDAITPHGIETMRAAVKATADAMDGEVDRESIAMVVFEFYSKGVIDVRKLTEIALFLNSSKAFSRVHRKH